MSDADKGAQEYRPGTRRPWEEKVQEHLDNARNALFDPCTVEWRNGRKVGRTVYAMVGTQPSDDDVLIGVMDTRDLACEVVLAHNVAGGWGPDECTSADCDRPASRVISIEDQGYYPYCDGCAEVLLRGGEHESPTPPTSKEEQSG